MGGVPGQLADELRRAAGLLGLSSRDLELVAQRLRMVLTADVDHVPHGPWAELPLPGMSPLSGAPPTRG